MSLLVKMKLPAVVLQKVKDWCNLSTFKLVEIDAQAAASELLNRDILMSNGQSLSRHVNGMVAPHSSLDLVNRLSLLKAFNNLVKRDFYGGNLSELDSCEDSAANLVTFGFHRLRSYTKREELVDCNKYLLRAIYPQTLRSKENIQILKQCGNQGIVLCAILKNN